MTPKQIQAIRARAERATPGPWHRLGPTTRGGFTFGENEIIGANGFTVVCWNGFDSADGTKGQRRLNARFIAQAREDISALLAEVERLHACKQ